MIVSKYIKVKINLEKTVKIDKDNLKDAIADVKDSLSELETTDEWINSRCVTIEEDKRIKDSSKYIAELFSKQVGDKHYKSDVFDFIKIAFVDNTIINYVYDETINIFEDDYNFNFVDKEYRRNKNI